MTHRLQVLIDEPRHQLLEREARRTGKSVARLIRESVDQVYGTDRTRRRAALDGLLEAEAMPVEDWDVMKQDLVADLDRTMS